MFFAQSTGMDDTTRFLAVYGAILSSIGLGWALYRDILDRPRLKIAAKVRRIVTGVGGRWFSVSPDLPVEGASEQLFVVMTAVNIGRRPVLWEGWGGKWHEPRNGKGAFYIVGGALPKMLNEGETHTEFTKLEADLHPANDNVKKLYVWDPSGREWKLSRRQLRKLRGEARKFSA